MAQETNYVMDAENVAEMARLIKQARLISEQMGLFPQTDVLQKAEAVLDIGCGPGEWVLQVAKRYPASQVTGIDISEVMTDYARTCARVDELPNAHFRLMNARQPLQFPDVAFDVIHARLMVSFLKATDWPLLLAECYRLLKPGGVVCDMEPEYIGVTTSDALSRYNELFIAALRKNGQCFTPHGSCIGITAVQSHLLEQAGFINIQQRASVQNTIVGTPTHMAFLEDCRAMLKLLQPFLVYQGVATQEELDILYPRALEEIGREDFCMIGYIQSVWGEKGS